MAERKQGLLARASDGVSRMSFDNYTSLAFFLGTPLMVAAFLTIGFGHTIFGVDKIQGLDVFGLHIPTPTITLPSDPDPVGTLVVCGIPFLAVPLIATTIAAWKDVPKKTE